MKADFSRVTFRPERHYSGVLMQQGRVQVDADWNEQVAIQRRRVEVETLDVVGQAGGPEDAAGFAIAVTGGTMTIGQGRYYVEGIAAENDVAELPFESQPDLAGPLDWVKSLADAKTTVGLAYLDVWDQEVTAQDDPLLREVALGGPDTAVRTRTVWQVRVLPLKVAANPDLEKKLRTRRTAVETKVAEVVAAGGDPADIADLRAQLVELDGRIEAARGIVSCDTPLDDWSALVAPRSGGLTARTQAPVAQKGACIVPPTAGYRRLENQLYRVEVHKPGGPGTATLKWSRDNGTVVSTIERISGKDVDVHDLGPDDALGFAGGQWVEISDDSGVLSGTLPQLVQIDTVNVALRRIVLKTAPTPLTPGATGVDTARHPRLRRWDQTGASATANGVASKPDFIPLEDGVEVRLEAGDYRTGDYWTIPARTAIGEIEWPPFAVPNTAPQPVPPAGIRHHFCRLAILAFSAETKAWTVTDCRKLFPPLTRLPAGGHDELEAVHVNGLAVAGRALRNDDRVLPEELLKGIEIVCDGPIEAGTIAAKPTCRVSLDLPFPAGAANEIFGTAPIGTIPLTLTGTTGLSDPSRITWFPDGGAARWLSGPAQPVLKELGEIVGHVVLKGNFVFAAGRPGVYVDGEAFGELHNGQLDVGLPSGNGVRGGDLELWFWLTPRRVVRPRPDRLVLLPAGKSLFITSPARRAGIAQMISLVLDRRTIADKLAGLVEVDQTAVVDGAKARIAAKRMRLEAGSVATIVVEERFEAAAELIAEALRQNDIPLEVRIVPVDDIVGAGERLFAGDRGADLIVATEDEMKKLAETVGELVSAVDAVTI